jgi:hypothetical protein
MYREMERGFFTGLGVLLFIQEKTGDAVRDTFERSRLMPEEGRRLMEDLSAGVEAGGGGLEDIIDDSIELGLRAVGLSTGRHLKTVKKRRAGIQRPPTR